MPPSLDFDWATIKANYAEVIHDDGYFTFVKNSVIVTGVSTLIALVLGVPAGYAFSRLRFRGSDTWASTILSFRFMPPVAVAIPIYLMIRYVGLLDSYPGLILPYVAFSLPLVVWIMIGFFDEIPREIDEAAMVDGLTRPFVLLKVLLPLARPGHARRSDVRGDLHLERVPRRPLRHQLAGPLDDPDRRLEPAHRGKPDRLEHRRRAGHLHGDPDPALLDLRAALHRARDHRGSGPLMASVSFAGVGKVYRDGTRALSDFDLDVADGEFMVFVGPSGCGKTTALRMVAGLEDITEGEVRIGERVVNGLHPRHRDIAMVFQNYALYPHMSVYRNIAFALKVRKTPPEEIKRRVEEAARILGLTTELKRKPGQLSGGQRQRVAMGRAIVRHPQVFLMDEPLSNLDAKLRVQMRAEIARIQRELGATTIYVTHDQVEAMTMGDRVAVLRKGQLQQVDSPQEVYDRPANLFVASFIGSPEMNLVEARLERGGDGLVCHVAGRELRLPPELVHARPGLEAYAGGTIGLGIRPEQLEDAALAGDAPRGSRLGGRVVTTELLGSELLAHVELEAPPVLTQEVREVLEDVDRSRVADLESEARARRTVVIGRFGIGSDARAGESIEMRVDARRLHFFDLASEAAIGVEKGAVADPVPAARLEA